MDVHWHDIPDRADLEIYDGPDMDVWGTQTGATVFCGEVSGSWTASSQATKMAGSSRTGASSGS
jgi:hypothetical protein